MGIRHQVVKVSRRRRSSQPADYIQVTSTKAINGGPHHAPTVVSVVGRNNTPSPRPIVSRTRYTQPPKDGLPNQVVVVDAPRRLRSAAPIIVRPPFKWGLNQGKTPNPPVVARRHVRAKKLNGIVTVMPATILEEQSPTSMPVVVPVAPVRRARQPVVLHSSFDAARRIPPRIVKPVHNRISVPVANPIIVHSTIVVAKKIRPPVVVPRYPRIRRLKGIMMILPGDAYELAPPLAAAPQVIPYHRNKAKDFRLPIVVSPKPSIHYRTNPSFAPIIVPRHVGVRPSPWVFTSQFLKFVPPPPRHEPMPRTLVVVNRRRAPALWPSPQVKTSILQPDDQRYTKPWDLIAACIAWLRGNAEIVAKFGDVKDSETHQKFVSDVELPRTDPPYVAFSEPIEVEHYESQDPSRRFSSRVEGVFQVHVVCTEKLVARQYADMIATALQDAPLEFTDGLLMYLRRTNRQFPSFKSTGPGKSVTLYKRIIEFNYIIERFF